MLGRRGSKLLALLLAAAVPLLLSGCTTPDEVDGDYAIEVQPIGHWHVFDQKTLEVRVSDAAGDGVPGRDVVFRIHSHADDRVRERSVSGEDVEDLGDGTYRLAYTPASVGSYALSVSLAADGATATSAPVAFEVAKAGEEGVRVTAGDGTEYVYQIRYVWRPGHIHASDADQVELVFEILRGEETGDQINWNQPWTNTFLHVQDAQSPVVRLTGAAPGELDAVHAGRGEYVAKRVFPPSEVGEGADYQVTFEFVDPHNGATVTNEEPFALRAVPAHQVAEVRFHGAARGPRDRRPWEAIEAALGNCLVREPYFGGVFLAAGVRR